VWESNPPRMV